MSGSLRLSSQTRTPGPAIPDARCAHRASVRILPIPAKSENRESPAIFTIPAKKPQLEAAARAAASARAGSCHAVPDRSLLVPASRPSDGRGGFKVCPDANAATAAAIEVAGGDSEPTSPRPHGHSNWTRQLLKGP